MYWNTNERNKKKQKQHNTFTVRKKRHCLTFHYKNKSICRFSSSFFFSFFLSSLHWLLLNHRIGIGTRFSCFHDKKPKMNSFFGLSFLVTLNHDHNELRFCCFSTISMAYIMPEAVYIQHFAPLIVYRVFCFTGFYRNISFFSILFFVYFISWMKLNRKSIIFHSILHLNQSISVCFLKE